MRALDNWRARAKRRVNLHPPPIASNACRYAAPFGQGESMNYILKNGEPVLEEAMIGHEKAVSLAKGEAA